MDGHQYLAARYVGGLTLAELLERGGPLALTPLLEIMTEIAAALDTLHREGLVHRDVKPSNVIVDDSGTSFLTDFGLAKGAAATVLTEPGHVVGTLDYLAPEAIKGGLAGPPADIYALGCVSYECIAAGRRLQAGASWRRRLRSSGTSRPIRAPAATTCRRASRSPSSRPWRNGPRTVRRPRRPTRSCCGSQRDLPSSARSSSSSAATRSVSAAMCSAAASMRLAALSRAEESLAEGASSPPTK